MLNKILSKKIKKVKISCEQKHPFNKKCKNKKKKKRFFIFKLKFQDHKILNTIIILVNNIKSKEKLFILKTVYKVK